MIVRTRRDDFVSWEAWTNALDVCQPAFPIFSLSPSLPPAVAVKPEAGTVFYLLFLLNTLCLLLTPPEIIPYGKFHNPALVAQIFESGSRRSTGGSAGLCLPASTDKDTINWITQEETQQHQIRGGWERPQITSDNIWDQWQSSSCLAHPTFPTVCLANALIYICIYISISIHFFWFCDC